MIKIDEGRGIIVRDVNGIHFEIYADYDDMNYGANDTFTVYADGEEIGTAKSRREAFDIMNNYSPRLQVASYKRESNNDNFEDVYSISFYDHMRDAIARSNVYVLADSKETAKDFAERLAVSLGYNPKATVTQFAYMDLEQYDRLDSFESDGIEYRK